MALNWQNQSFELSVDTEALQQLITAMSEKRHMFQKLIKDNLSFYRSYVGYFEENHVIAGTHNVAAGLYDRLNGMVYRDNKYM